MPISEIVEQIIERRNSKVPFIEEKKKELEEMLSLLEEFECFKSEVIDADGNVIDGKYKIIAEKNPEMPIKLNVLSSSECKRKIEKALEECEKIHKRFSRDSINIAVIGKARIGKSEFLKSISNLSNYVIPAFAETDCTGAVSIIQNKPGVDLVANLTFKTEDQMVKIVQTYLDRIIPNEENRMVVRNLYNIRDLDMDEVDRRKVFGRSDNNLVQYLAKFVEHYEEWAPLIQQKSLVLYDEKEIQTYVAQNNGEKEEEKRLYFYKYLAVDSCEITCTFDYKEAGKITLVDTVGFEDNAIGIEDELIKVVNDKSDAVVFMLFPLDVAGGGVPAKIKEIYEKIEVNCRGKNLDKWLFWLINHAPNHPYTPNPIGHCNTTLKTLESNSWAGEIRRIVDVSDQEQVREEFLIPLLNTLMNNLDEIDDLFFDDLRAALSDVQKEYSTFCSSAKKLMDSQIGNASAMHPQMARSIDDLCGLLNAKLKEMASKEKEKRNLPCDILKERVTGILEKLKDNSLIPDDETIKFDLTRYQAPTVYNRYCNAVRTEITRLFSEVDASLTKLVEEVKDKITDVLVSNEGCRLGRIMSQNSEKPYEWLKMFAENILSDSDYINLYPAFMNVYNFDFSVKGFLTYEVRACLDGIDPDLTNVPNIIGTNDNNTADRIKHYLTKGLYDVYDLLNERVSELFRKPHRAFFAIIKEFSDKVIYADNVKYEWDRLFSENYSVIWAEDYKNMAIAAASFEAWSDLLKRLLELYSKTDTFIV